MKYLIMLLSPAALSLPAAAADQGTVRMSWKSLRIMQKTASILPVNGMSLPADQKKISKSTG